MEKTDHNDPFWDYVRETAEKVRLYWPTWKGGEATSVGECPTCRGCGVLTVHPERT